MCRWRCQCQAALQRVCARLSSTLWRARRRRRSTSNRVGALGAFSTGQGGVQAIKAREVEHVRYRAVAVYPKDVELQAIVQGMRAAAREEVSKCDCGRNLFQLPWLPGSAFRGVHEFLSAAHQRSLWVTQLQV